VNERKCTIAWALDVRAAAVRQVRKCLYSVPRREHGLHAHRVWQASSATSLLFVRSENGKYENDKLFRFPSRRGSSHSNQSALVPRIGPKKRTIDARQYTASTKESHLRYYIRTRIIQGQIWVLNEVKFARAVLELRIHWFGESDTSTYSLIYDNNDNGNINFKCSKMRS